MIQKHLTWSFLFLFSMGIEQSCHLHRIQGDCHYLYRPDDRNLELSMHRHHLVLLEQPVIR